ncbi:hypothetical protein VTN00DRAFT_6446 [Thermoascus crustaceus]|uniref:uncharacterized protein n=1 Tax=Thermoascus crustaceus TaxID=5088 RepID=UPI003742FDC6
MWRRRLASSSGTTFCPVSKEDVTVPKGFRGKTFESRIQQSDAYSVHMPSVWKHSQPVILLISIIFRVLLAILESNARAAAWYPVVHLCDPAIPVGKQLSIRSLEKTRAWSLSSEMHALPLPTPVPAVSLVPQLQFQILIPETGRTLSLSDSKTGKGLLI